MENLREKFRTLMVEKLPALYEHDPRIDEIFDWFENEKQLERPKVSDSDVQEMAELYAINEDFGNKDLEDGFVAGAKWIRDEALRDMVATSQEKDFKCKCGFQCNSLSALEWHVSECDLRQ